MADGSENLQTEFWVNQASTIGSSSAAAHDPVLWPFQKCAFYTVGRRWVFYSDGTNLVFRTSADGITWGAATTVRACISGKYFSIHFDGTYVHYAYADGIANNPILYRRGTPQSNGTIVWSAVEQTAYQPGEVTEQIYEPSVSVDSSGYPYITFKHFYEGGWRIYAMSSLTNDGTWSEWWFKIIEGGVGATARHMILPLTDRKMYVVFIEEGDDNIYGCLTVGPGETDWQAVEDSGADISGTDCFDAVSFGDQVHLIWTEKTTFKIQHRKRTYGTGWSASHTIYDAVLADIGASICRGTEEDIPTLYVFWTPDMANPTADHVFYKISTDDGATWTASPVDWIDESADTFPLPNQQSAFFFQGEFQFGCVWVRSSPDEVRYGELSGNANASEDLLGEFHVGQDSKDLLGEFHVGQDSEDLLGEFEVAHWKDLLGELEVMNKAEADLLGELIIQNEDEANLLAELVVQHDAEANLLGEFEVLNQDSADLLGEFKIKHPGVQGIFGKFIVRHETFQDLLAEFIVKHETSQDLLGETLIRNNSFAELLGEFIVKHDASQNLLGELIIRNEDYQDLLCEALIRNESSAVLLGEFEVAHWEDLQAEFQVTHWKDLLGEANIVHWKSLPCEFWVRWPYRLWTTRRYLNGVIKLDENLLGDAILEYVIEGVMEDIQGVLTNSSIAYDSWTTIVDVPVQIRRATTYGTVAALYARHARTFTSRVIPTVAPVTVTVIGDDERAMKFWEDKMNKAIDLYLAIAGGITMKSSTEDEEPIFSMEDIPADLTAEDTWHQYLQKDP